MRSSVQFEIPSPNQSSSEGSVFPLGHATLNEVRTDPDVEDAIRARDDPNAIQFLGWTSQQGEECGDFPVLEANPLSPMFSGNPANKRRRHCSYTVPIL